MQRRAERGERSSVAKQKSAQHPCRHPAGPENSHL